MKLNKRRDKKTRGASQKSLAKSRLVEFLEFSLSTTKISLNIKKATNSSLLLLLLCILWLYIVTCQQFYLSKSTWFGKVKISLIIIVIKLISCLLSSNDAVELSILYIQFQIEVEAEFDEEKENKLDSNHKLF